eukprot:1475367-Prymnesium_polylepis.1
MQNEVIRAGTERRNQLVGIAKRKGDFQLEFLWVAGRSQMEDIGIGIEVIGKAYSHYDVRIRGQAYRFNCTGCTHSTMCDEYGMSDDQQTWPSALLEFSEDLVREAMLTDDKEEQIRIAQTMKLSYRIWRMMLGEVDAEMLIKSSCMKTRDA